MKRLINFVFLAAGAVLLWFVYYQYNNDYLLKGVYTFAALAAAYLVFKLGEEVIGKMIKEVKTRYFFSKITSLTYVILMVVVVITIWIEDPQVLLVSYGLVAAGVAIALQDFFKNLMGGLMILVTGSYHVGDRIEVKKKYGDVVDIGVFYTTIMEIKDWVEGDQPTGRLTSIPNGYVLFNTVDNYTKDYGFIWDEIKIPITYGSDWQKAIKKIMKIVEEGTENLVKKAEKEIKGLKRKYYFSRGVLKPSIYLTMTDNWITFNIRYIVEAKERRVLHNQLSQKILRALQKDKKIKIASETLDIIGFPGKKK